MDFEGWKQELRKWHSLEGFHDKLGDVRAEHGLPRLLVSTDGFYRDADTACRFASLRAATKVRLGADPPDFEMEVAEGAREFEIVEADTPRRKRNDEVKGLREMDASRLTPDVAEQILHDRAARKKERSEKNEKYRPGWGLLIMLNHFQINLDLADQRAIEARMADATAVAKDRFAEVWVLWQDTAYNTWRGRAPGTRVLHRPEPSEEPSLPEPLGAILADPDQGRSRR